MKARPPFTALALTGALFVAAAAAAPAALAADCARTIGSVLSLTGSYGVHGVPISRAAQLGVEQVEAARAALGAGCALTYDVRDSQTQPSVAVDAAAKLIDIDGVQALVGPISSGITGPLLTSVTVAKGVVVIATASTSTTFTNMAREGKTKGLFFRTLPADSLQAVATSKMAYDAGFRKVATIYLNNDWGKNNQAEFSRAFVALGGAVGNIVPFNPDQPSYRSEINKVLEGEPDALYLLANPNDGSKQLRDWIRFGGASGLVLPQGMNEKSFVETVGDAALENAWFITPVSPKTESFQTVNADFQACCELTIDGGPGRTSGYDAGALLALATVPPTSPGWREAARISPRSSVPSPAPRASPFLPASKGSSRRSRCTPKARISPTSASRGRSCSIRTATSPRASRAFGTGAASSSRRRASASRRSTKSRR